MEVKDVYEARRQSICAITRDFEIPVDSDEVGRGITAIKVAGSIGVGVATGLGAREVMHEAISHMDFSNKSKTIRSCIELLGSFVVCGAAAYCVNEYNKTFDEGVKMVRAWKIVKTMKLKECNFKKNKKIRKLEVVES